MKRAVVLLLPLLFAACTGVKSPHPSAEIIFDSVAPSVVAVVNDDTKDREEETKELERLMGKDPRAPKHVIDVSLRKEATPHGTGFAIDAREMGLTSGVLIGGTRNRRRS